MLTTASTDISWLDSLQQCSASVAHELMLHVINSKHYTV